MKLEDALFRRHPQPKREAVVASAAMDVEAVLAAGPQAMVRDARERREDSLREPHPEEPELAAVRVPGEHEVGAARRKVTKRSWIVEEPDAHNVTVARVT